jgi:hypothetical protein
LGQAEIFLRHSRDLLKLLTSISTFKGRMLNLHFGLHNISAPLIEDAHRVVQSQTGPYKEMTELILNLEETID